jgi:hypothetical protein
MTAQTKDFELSYPSDSPRGSTLFTPYPSIISTVAREFQEQTSKAPTADEVARDIVSSIERTQSPRKVWLGYNAFLFKWVVPYLPVKVADGMWSKAMRMDLMVKVI